MVEGVSRSVIAKQEQTISQENSPLILLKLSLIPRCAAKKLGVVLYKLFPQQKGTQVKIFSLSPGIDIMLTTCIFGKKRNSRRIFGDTETFFSFTKFQIC